MARGQHVLRRVGGAWIKGVDGAGRRRNSLATLATMLWLACTVASFAPGELAVMPIPTPVFQLPEMSSPASIASFGNGMSICVSLTIASTLVERVPPGPVPVLVMSARLAGTLTRYPPASG